MSGYVLGGDAEQDLDEIWEYIAEDSVDAADRLMAKLFEAFEELARSPRMGHKREISPSSHFSFGQSVTTSSSTGQREVPSRLSQSPTASETSLHSCSGEVLANKENERPAPSVSPSSRHPNARAMRSPESRGRSLTPI